MMNGEEIRFCFKCEVSFSTCEDLSEHSCNTLNPDTSDKKNEKEHVVSKNEFNPDMTSVESKPVTTFKKLYECHRKRFPNVKVTSSNREFKETSAICLQELLQLDKKDILENEIFWKEIQNFVDHVPLYLPNHYKKKKGNSGPGNRYRIFKAHKYFYEREFNILPSNNSSLIYEEIEGNPEVNDNEIHLDMSCDEIRPHTSYKKLFQHHRSRFPNVRVGYQKEFKETSEICLQELLQLDKKDILKNEKFQQKIKDFIIYAPRYWKKKNCSRNKMFAAYKQFFEHEFTILNISHANKSDKSCETVINDVSNDVSNDISNDVSNDMSNDVSNDMSNDVSYKFINDELELHPDLVLSSEELDKIENNIEQQTLDNGFKLDVSEEFLSKILKTVDELCDDIKNGDPDIERMLQVNLNLNNAVSCYKNMLSFRKQNFVQKKNQEHVNHMTREIIQSYQCDDEYIDKDFKDNQITIGLENFGQSYDKDDNRGFENLQSEENRKSRKRKRLKIKEIGVKCDDKKLENGMDSLLSESENTLIEKQTECKDQMINQDSGNAAFESTEKVFNYDDISDIQSYPYLRFGNEKGMFQCAICNHMSCKRSDSLKHIKRKHKKEIRSKEEGLNGKIAAENDVCQKSLCKKLYGSHGVGRKFWCKGCKKLRTSIKKNHIKRKELCRECGKNVCNLRDHILRVHTVETVKCSICEKMLKNAKVLKAHNATVHDEKVPCVHCGKLYGVKQMWRHIQAQHTSNQDKKYKCEVCGKGFVGKEMLKDHKHIHTGEKPYLCQFCSACFASKGTHAMHERIHLGRGRKNTKK